MQWIKCKDRLPSEVKMYGVIVTESGAMSTDLLTPSKKYAEDAAYNWLTFNVDAWIELPEHWYPYKEQWGGWFTISMHTELKETYYFVQTQSHEVTLCKYFKELDSFFGPRGECFTRKNVLVVWEVPEYNSKECN